MSEQFLNGTSALNKPFQCHRLDEQAKLSELVVARPTERCDVRRLCQPAIEAWQWRNDGVAAASSDGGPTGGRGPRQF